MAFPQRLNFGNINYNDGLLPPQATLTAPARRGTELQELQTGIGIADTLDFSTPASTRWGQVVLASHRPRPLRTAESLVCICVCVCWAAFVREFCCTTKSTKATKRRMKKRPENTAAKQNGAS